MLVQMISGRVADRTKLRRQFDRWATELSARAAGFLDVTAGMTPGGIFVAAARFEDRPQVGQTSQLLDQTAWWLETPLCFTGEAEIRESDDIELLGPGRSGDAGFVQVIEGRTPDRNRFMELERKIEKGFATERPDFLGSFLAWWPEGRWVEVAYFRSEADTRAAEQKGLSGELTEIFTDWQAVAGPSSYLDVSEPWLVG